MITIAELFPLFSTASKWFETFRRVSNQETVRLEKEYTIKHSIQFREFLLECTMFQECTYETLYTLEDYIHRTDGPARITHRKDGTVYSKYWYKYGEIHREDGPAIIIYGEHGKIKREEWYYHGKMHRENGPAYTNYYECIKIWFHHGLKHREDGPAWIEYHEKSDLSDPFVNGKIDTLKWFVNNKNSRQDGPAIVRFDEQGQIIDIVWIQTKSTFKVDNGLTNLNVYKFFV